MVEINVISKINKANEMGIILPYFAKNVGGDGCGRLILSRPATPASILSNIWPLLYISELTPVGVTRMMGIPSSIARSRPWASCCGGPHGPNHASLLGEKNAYFYSTKCFIMRWYSKGCRSTSSPKINFARHQSRQSYGF